MSKKFSILLIIFLVFFSFHSVFAQNQSFDEEKSDKEFREAVHDLFDIFKIYSNPTTSPSGIPSSAPSGSLSPSPTGKLSGTPTKGPIPTNAKISPSPTPSKQTGGGGIASVADNALFLYNLIKTCPGEAATTTNGCFDRIKNVDRITNSGAREELRKSIFDVGLNKLQCVGFAKATAALDGRAWNVSYGPAATYAASAPPSGYRKILKGQEPIQVGDYVFWGVGSKSPYGHVAVVVHVESDGNAFDVVEANVAGRGEMNRATRRINSGDYWSSVLKAWYRKV